jgi:hypothetical protein
MDTEVFKVIGLACIVVMFIGMMAITAFAPDVQAKRIAACMTQTGMQYVGDDCVPVHSE